MVIKTNNKLMVVIITTIAFFVTSGDCSNIIKSSMSPSATGSIEGKIVDAETEEPIGWTNLLIDDINRSVSAHSDGSFHFYNIPAGKYKLRTFRIGYDDKVMPIEILENDTTYLKIQLQSRSLTASEINIDADRYDIESELMKPDIEVSGKKLRQNLGMTIAETIESEPGLAQRTMGPAPARPVLRGLSGDRFLMLEDGKRTGDLSATSSDHAVVIEPISSERIEIVRGPEALLFGSNTLGGVINVVRDYIPATLPHRITGATSLQGESVNNGFAGGLSLELPVKSFALKLDGSIRNAEDICTPVGNLKNTSLYTVNSSFGISYFMDWGNFGTAASYYESDYGIPPQPDTLGGHPNGVDIVLFRRHIESRAEIYPGLSWIHHIQINHSYKHYKHSEYESNNLVGMRFGVLTHNFSLTAHLPEKGVFAHGKIGFWGELRDYATSGLSFTPNSKENSFAVFIYNEHKFGKFAFNSSVRYDLKSVVPDEEKVINRADYSNYIRKRNFSDISASISGVYDIGSHCSLGTTLMKSYRAPGIEELYSEGPHLAAYAYEVGNAELRKESGIGAELFFDVKHERGKFHFALFRNDIHSYIFPKNTGRPSLRIASLYLYQYVGEHALMQGVESSWDWNFIDSWNTSGSVSYVYGKLVNRNQAMPLIPPLETKINLKYDWNQLTFGVDMRAAAKQNRTGEFENTTQEYVIFDANIEYYFNFADFLHTISLAANNLGDTEYRQHLNRVKEIMPEPGRNIKLLYKVFF